MSKHKTKLFIDGAAMASPNRSGIGHLVLSMAKSLDKVGHDYDIYAFIPWRQWKYIKDVEFSYVKLRRLPLPGRALNLLSRMKICPPLDIFLGKGVYVFPNYKNWPLLFSKSITFVDDVAYALYPSFVEPKNKKMLDKYMPRWIKRSDLVATISKSSGEEVKELFHLPEEKLAVIYCGVEEEFYPRPKNEILEVQKKYALPDKYFFFLSNIEPRKNLATLIDAFGLLPESIIKQYALLIVGGMGWLNDDIVQKINSFRKRGINIIHPDFYVPDEDLPALHSGAIALIQPSFHEGFGLAPLQAMACGTPVILSDIPVFKEIAGAAAIYFKPKKTNDLAKAMLSLANNKQKREGLSQLGLKRSSAFTWEKFATELLSMVAELTTRGRGSNLVQ